MKRKIKSKESTIEDIYTKYGAKLEKQITTEKQEGSGYSREYVHFKKELIPSLSGYEKICRNFGNTFKVKLKKEDNQKIQSSLDAAHLDITPGDSAAFSLGIFLLAIFLSVFISLGIYFLTDTFPMLVFFLLFFISIFSYYYTSGMPQRLAQKWRLKASSQMVPCILYIVVYMRHTSNLELAVKFASEHLQAPLSLDLKKVFWNVETGKYSTIRESLDAYLESWRSYSLEFVEAFNLIEGSLYEPNESRRIEVLEKALSVILDGIHEKMLHYTHDVQAPLTNVYMLGIVLPTLAIALLPLASALVGESIKWPHIMLFFNILVPFLVFYLTSQILSKRPGGYGEEDLLEQNPNYASFKSNTPYKKAALIAIPLIIIGLLPLIWQFTPLPSMIGMEKDYSLDVPILAGQPILDFKNGAGPFGLVALLLSLCIPMGAALFFFISYKQKTQHLIETRNKTKALEKQFASGMFQLGNRLGDGVPAEMAFGHVAETLKGTPTADFFNTVNSNIRRMGMSVNEAIFNQTRGAIIYFPSNLIRTSMRILIESVKKGLNVAARALMSISQYTQNINKINERLKDLLAEVVSSMKSNMSFLAPVLAGIVVGLAAMISTILSRLQLMIEQMPSTADATVGGLGSVGALTDLFNVQNMIPPYFLQIITGIYLVQIVYILTITLVSIENGFDKLKEKSEIAKNMKISILTYIIVSLISIIILTVLAGTAIGGIGVG